MNEFIIIESALCYTLDYFTVITNAQKSDIEALNILEHRATWVRIKDIELALKNKGFNITVKPMTPKKPYYEYYKDDNCIILKYGNY